MDNPFAKLKPRALGNILSRCDMSDIARMRCTDRALASLLKTQAVRREIYECKKTNSEYGYSLIIFEAQNSHEIMEQKAIRVREVRLIKAENGVVMLENDATPRKRLAVYEGNRTTFNLKQLWHQLTKLPANESSVLSFTAAGNGPHNFMVMKTDELEWKWREHEECRFTHPFVNFSFIVEGDMFLKITSLLPTLPLPVRYATSIRCLSPHIVGTEFFDVNTEKQIDQPHPAWEVVYVLPHVAFELKHVLELGDGVIYMMFVGDKSRDQVDFGACTIEDLGPERLEFAVVYQRKVTGSTADDTCKEISCWLQHFLLPSIYAAPTSSHFDQVEFISSHNNDLFILRREKSGEGILVELWLDMDNKLGKPASLMILSTGDAHYVVSFCVWRLSAQHFGIDSILVLAKLRNDGGIWWIVQRQNSSIVLVSRGMLPGISDGTRFSLARLLQPK